MKNLKKVLSLVLALAMALSLMTVAFAADAKDYADYGEVNYNEAVDVMTAVGVFDGMNGSFNPDGTLTREQAAKIITYMLMGKSDADKLTTTIAPYSDVSASRWSAGAIAYCTNEGIISGMGHNKFAPTDEVTGLQFAKMLLVALGYDAEIEELVGDSWAINTSKLAIAVGLDNGMEEISLSGDLTREQAAQMAFNAMQAPLVEYGSKGTTIEVNGATVTFGAQQAQYVTTTIAKTQTISNTKLSNSNDYTIEFAEQYCQDLRKLDGDTDAFERPATTWRLKNADIGTYADEADLTYTSATKIGTIYNDLGLTRGIDGSDVIMYVDGNDNSWNPATDIVKGGRTEINGDGALMDVYYDVENGTVTIVVVNTYVAKINSVYGATTTKDAYVVLNANAADHFTGPGGGEEFETTGFSKDDIVAYTYSHKDGEDCVQSVELAEAVTGAMSTSTTTGSVTVAGTKYDANTASASEIASYATSIDKGSDVTVYLDAYGYALYVDADVEVNYAVVLDYDAQAGDWNDVEKAKLLLTDGSIVTKEVELAGIQPATNSSETLAVGSTNFYTADDRALTQYDIVAYTVDSDDVYALTLVADAEEGKGGGQELVTNGINTINAANSNLANLGSGTGSKATTAVDGKTIFLVYDSEDNVASVYEGFANVPTIKTVSGDAPMVSVFMDSTVNNTPASVVFIEKNAQVNIVSNNEDVVYIKGNKDHNATDGKSYTTALGYFYQYDGFINGDPATIMTEEPVTVDTLVYGPEYNSKGIMVDLDKAEGYVNSVQTNDMVDNTGKYHMVYTTDTDSVVNDVIKLGTVNYAYTSDVNVYYLTMDGELVARDITDIGYDEDDMVFLKTNDKGLLTDVYVKAVDTEDTVDDDVPANITTIALQPGAANQLKVNLQNGGTATTTETKADVTVYVLNSGDWVAIKTVEIVIPAGTAANNWGTEVQINGLASGQYKATCGDLPEVFATIA